MKDRYSTLLGALVSRVKSDRFAASEAAVLIDLPHREAGEDKGLQVVLGWVARAGSRDPFSSQDPLAQLTYYIKPYKYTSGLTRRIDALDPRRLTASEWVEVLKEEGRPVLDAASGRLLRQPAKTALSLDRICSLLEREQRDVEAGFWSIGWGWVSVRPTSTGIKHVPRSWDVFGQNPQAVSWTNDRYTARDGSQRVARCRFERVGSLTRPVRADLFAVVSPDGELIGETCLTFQTTV